MTIWRDDWRSQADFPRRQNTEFAANLFAVDRHPEGCSSALLVMGANPQRRMSRAEASSADLVVFHWFFVGLRRLDYREMVARLAGLELESGFAQAVFITDVQGVAHAHVSIEQRRIGPIIPIFRVSTRQK